MGRPGAPWSVHGQQWPHPGPAHRRPRRGLVGGPLRPSSGRRHRGPAPVLPRGQLRQPPRHRPLPPVDADQAPRRPALPPRSAVGPRSPDRARGPGDQARGPDRLPSGLSVRLRPTRRHRPHLPAQRPGLPGPLPPAPRRGRRPRGPGPPGGDRRDHRRRRPRAHRRPRRPPRRPWRPPPEVVQPLRRGHPGPVDHCPGGHDDHGPRSDRGAHLPRRCGPHPARRRRARPLGAGPRPGRGVQRGAPPARCRPAPRGRRDHSGGPGPGRLPHDPGQRAGGRQRGVGGGPPVRADRPPTRAPSHPGPGPRRRQLRGSGRPGGRGRRPGRCRAPLEARAHLRRPGHLDRAGGPAPRRRRPRWPRPPDRARPGPVGALRPRRRPGRGGQPGDRPGRRRRVRPAPGPTEGRASHRRARAAPPLAVCRPPVQPPGRAGDPAQAGPAPAPPGPAHRHAPRGRRRRRPSTCRVVGPSWSRRTTGSSTSGNRPGSLPRR